MEKTAEFNKGTVLDGRFEICEVLKPGRAARAADRSTGKKVFLKRWEPGDPDAETEKVVLEKLRTPQVPEVIGAFRTEEGEYLAERWTEGKSLEEIVRAEGPLDTVTALEILDQAAQAVGTLHWHGEGPMVYIDLKPSNIMVDGFYGAQDFRGKSAGISVSLVDFESVRLPGGGRVREAGAAAGEGEAASGEEQKEAGRDPGATYRLGSQYFVAPEVLFGEVTPESDIYSLGVILGFMLVGKANYPGTYRIRKPLGALLDRATASDPSERFDGINGLLEAVKGIRADMQKSDAAEKARRKRRAAEGILGNARRREKSSGAGSGAEAPEWKGSEIGAASERRYGEPMPLLRELKRFRRTLAVVEHNPCFAGNLARIAAESGLRTAVFALSERGRRNVNYYVKGGRAEKPALELAAESGCFPYIFDHKSMFLHGAEEWKKRGLLERSPDNELFVATYKLGLELPLRTQADLERFADWCFANFDLTLLSAERSDDEMLLSAAGKVCSRIISTPDSNVEDMEAARDYFTSRAETGKIMLPKVRYVAWNYSEEGLPREKMEEIVGRDRYLGEVERGSNALRLKNRVTELKPYLDEKEQQAEEEQYGEILERLIG